MTPSPLAGRGSAHNRSVFFDFKFIKMIVKVRNKSRFAQISNKVLRDKRLSLESRGALCEILSYSEEFDTSVKSLMKLWGINRKKLLKITNELKQFGYLEIVNVRNEKGHIFDKDWIFYGKPQDFDFPAPVKTEDFYFNQDAENRDVGNRHDGNQDAENRDVGNRHPGHIYKDLNTDLNLKDEFKKEEDCLKTHTQDAPARETAKNENEKTEECVCVETNDFFNLNSFSQTEEHSKSEFRYFSAKILDGIKARLKLAHLPPNHTWFELCQFAFANKFTAEQVLLCYDTLEKQRLLPDFWRRGRITASTVIENLPITESLISEINEVKNGRLQTTAGRVDAGTRNSERLRDANAFIEELESEARSELAALEALQSEYHEDYSQSPVAHELAANS